MTAPARVGRRGVGLSLVVAAVWLLLDQLTKTWAVRSLDDRTIHIVWTLRLALTFNSGMAFSKGTGLGPIIGVVALVVVVVLLIGSRRSGSTVTTVLVGVVIGGAIGNVADRLFRSGSGGFLHGRVIDFVDLQWWPVFNVADIGVVCGGIGLVVMSLVEERRHRHALLSTGTTDSTTDTTSDTTTAGNSTGNNHLGSDA